MQSLKTILHSVFGISVVQLMLAPSAPYLFCSRGPFYMIVAARHFLCFAPKESNEEFGNVLRGFNPILFWCVTVPGQYVSNAIAITHLMRNAIYW